MGFKRHLQVILILTLVIIQNQAADDCLYVVNNTKNCQKCPPGYHKVNDCQAHNEQAVCRHCEDGVSYHDKCNNKTMCIRCSTHCQMTKPVLVKPCTPKNDIVCECESGRYWSPDAPGSVDGICLRHNKCPVGQGLSKKGTAYNNTECQTCLHNVSFSDEDSMIACQKCTTCTVYNSTCMPYKNAVCGHINEKEIYNKESSKGFPYWGIALVVVIAVLVFVVGVLIYVIWFHYRCGRNRPSENPIPQFSSDLLENDGSLTLECMPGVNIACENNVQPTIKDDNAHPVRARSVTPDSTSITNSMYAVFPTRSSSSSEIVDTANSSTASRNSSITLSVSHDVSDEMQTFDQPDKTTSGEFKTTNANNKNCEEVDNQAYSKKITTTDGTEKKNKRIGEMNYRVLFLAENLRDDEFRRFIRRLYVGVENNLLMERKEKEYPKDITEQHVQILHACAQADPSKTDNHFLKALRKTGLNSVADKFIEEFSLVEHQDEVTGDTSKRSDEDLGPIISQESNQEKLSQNSKDPKMTELKEYVRQSSIIASNCISVPFEERLKSLPFTDL